jgi:acetyl-CoA carboxylase biotin carboxyl carrier protein
MNFEQVQAIIKTFEDSTLRVLEIEQDGFKIRLSKNNDLVIEKQVESQKEIIETPVENGVAVKSPLVGTFYASSSPEELPFVAVGDTVVAGQKLCIIEAMKIMNDITSPISGTVTRILPQDGTAVGYDQIIMTIV